MRVLFRSWDLLNRSVFYRVDANVSAVGDRLPRRIASIFPTVRALCEAGAQVTIATHRGRPDRYDPTNSTQFLVEIIKNTDLYALYGERLFLLENLRFDQREYSNDHEYARELAAGHTHYVTDAWGVLHKAHASIVACPLQFSKDHRSVGDLIMHELKLLAPLRTQSIPRWGILLGGGKVAQKIGSIEYALATGAYPPAVFMGPGGTAVMATKLAAQCDTWGSNFFFCEGNEKVAPTMRGISEKEAHRLAERIIESVDALFVTGVMGVDDEQRGYELLLTILEKSGIPLWIGGGGTSDLYDRLFPEGKAGVSTGGGSSLAYICGEQLPGLAAIEETIACP